MNSGMAFGGVFMFFFFVIYLTILVFMLIMVYRAVRAFERIAGAQERRASVAERTGQP